MPTAILADGAVRWVLADAYDGTVIGEGDGDPPAGSETRGVRG